MLVKTMMVKTNGNYMIPIVICDKQGTILELLYYWKKHEVLKENDIAFKKDKKENEIYCWSRDFSSLIVDK